MEKEYWEHFWSTGKIEDYLYYKGMAICKNVMERHGNEAAGESDNSDGNGASGNTYS